MPLPRAYAAPSISALPCGTTRHSKSASRPHITHGLSPDKNTVPAGTQIRLRPGESLWVTQGMYHDFAVEKGTGAVLLGEVSQCNDDNTDNRFNPPVGRFPKIEEDEPPYRLLCNEYPIESNRTHE